MPDYSQAAVKRAPLGAESLTVINHLNQQSSFMIKSGLRFYPLQDDWQKSREKFITSLIKANRLDLYLWGICRLYLSTGSLLWYLRPIGARGYEVHWFCGGDDQTRQYRCFYKPGGRELDYVTLRYWYRDESPNIPGHNAPESRIIWVRLIINNQTITEQHYRTIPSLDLFNDATGTGATSGAIYEQTVVNTLGFIPCVESPNDPLYPGDSGYPDWAGIEQTIDAENQMAEALTNNVFAFGNSTLVTTRPANQVYRDIQGNETIPKTAQTWAQANGYYGTASPNIAGGVPFVRRNEFQDTTRRRGGVARVIGGVREDERFGYIFPNPINADQWRYHQEVRESIHQALGGIDPLSYRYVDWQSLRGITGQVETTAKRKCLGLFTYGLCELLRMAILNEEQLFLMSAKSLLKPKNPGAVSDTEVMEWFYKQEQLPPQVIGLPPYGDTTIAWQHLGPIYEPDAREKQVATINMRNLQEAGVGILPALREMYPGKTDKELKAMSTGFPLRITDSYVSVLERLIQTYMNLSTIPDPADPNVSLAMRTQILTVIDQLSKSMQNQLTLEQNYDPSDPNTEPRIQRPDGSAPAADGTGSAVSLPVPPATGIDWATRLPTAGGDLSAAASPTNLADGGRLGEQLGPESGGSGGSVPDGVPQPGALGDAIYLSPDQFAALHGGSVQRDGARRNGRK